MNVLITYAMTIPFKLHLLPAVALRHVLSVMPLADLSFLTFFFEIFRKFAKNIHKIPQEIRIDFNYPDYSYYIFMGEKSKTPVLRFSGRSKMRKSRIRRIGGKDIKIASRILPPAPLVTCLYANVDSLWTEIERTIIGLYGLLPPIDLSLTASQVPIYPETCKKIRNLTIKYNDYHEIGSVKSAHMNDFFETHTVIQRFTVECLVEGTLKTFSNFTKCDTIQLKSSDWFTAHHLINFTGSHLKLRNVIRVNTYDLISFISLWFNGNNRTLKSVSISYGYFDEQLVRNEFRGVLKEYDGERRAAKYGLRKANDTDDAVDCTNAMDMERPSDGLLASIKMTPRQFHFLVWHERF